MNNINLSKSMNGLVNVNADDILATSVITNSLAVLVSASAPTPTAGDNSTKIATTAFVAAAAPAGVALLSGAAFTGAISAPSATVTGGVALSSSTDGRMKVGPIFGNFNFSVGDGVAMSAITSGVNNTGIGRNTLSACTTGRSNTAMGYAALPSLTVGIDNIAIGESSQYSTGVRSHQRY